MGPGSDAQVLTSDLVAQVSTGLDHACARRGTDLFCWGGNLSGQVGLPASSTEPPTQVPGAWLQVEAGGDSTCAIDEGRNLYCWGDNTQGKLGSNSTEAFHADPQLVGLSQIAQVSVGRRSACARDVSFQLWCWGSNDMLQLGLTSDIDASSEPIQIAGQWTWVSAGEQHICAIDLVGGLWCWGLNTSGQLGQGLGFSELSSWPARVEGGWLSVGAAQTHTCGVRQDGTLWCWGRERFGQLGNGVALDESTSPSPTAALTNRRFVEVETSWFHGCARTQDNEAWCWGWNRFGALGVPEGSSSLVPTRVQQVAAIQLDAGRDYSCFVDADAEVFCSGQNNNGEMGRSGFDWTFDPTIVDLP